MNRIHAVQGCDARDDDEGTVAGNKKGCSGYASQDD